MSQLFPGIHQITVSYHSRPLHLHLLIGDAGAMLIDAGGPEQPDGDILPYFKSIDFDPGRLTWVLCTHPDTDHSGGLHRMKQLAPNARFTCGAADRAQVESPEAIVDIRARAYFHWHGLGPEGTQRAQAIANAGGYAPMDVTLSGGEEIRLGGDFLVRVLHLPGHSRGHLGVFVPQFNLAIIGDAVQETAARKFDGMAAFACTYMYVDEYLNTIEQLRGMKLDRLFSGHWKNCNNNEEVTAWLNLSRDYAQRAEAAVLHAVRKSPVPVTLREVCVQAKAGLGDWPAERDLVSQYMVHGHLERLTNMGVLNASDTRPVTYALNPTWQGLKI